MVLAAPSEEDNVGVGGAHVERDDAGANISHVLGTLHLGELRFPRAALVGGAVDDILHRAYKEGVPSLANPLQMGQRWEFCGGSYQNLRWERRGWGWDRMGWGGTRKVWRVGGTRKV